MILPHPDRLNKFNKYALVVLVANRTRQLQEQGMARRALVKSSSSNPLTVALEEVAAGRLIPSFNPGPLPELIETEIPESTLAEGFEEAMAKVAVEAGIQTSDNGHAQVTEAEGEEAQEGLSEEEEEIAKSLDRLLGLEEEEEDSEEPPIDE